MKRFRLLAVASAKGSPGCTFVAAGLAGALAERGLVTLLADADAEEAGIASLLDLPAMGVRRKRSGRLAPLQASALAESVTALTPNLHCLEMAPTGGEGRDLLGAADAYGAVVVDLGHHLGGLQRSILEAADWLLWVATPDRVGVERADRKLGEMEERPDTTGLVLNRCGRHTLADAGVVLAERHRLTVVARLPESEAAAARLLRRALPGNRAREFRRGFEELARTVHPDLQRPDRRGRGGAWSS